MYSQKSTLHIYFISGIGRVQHGEEGRYLSYNMAQTDFPEADYLTSDRFVTLLTNFIKYM